MTGPSVPSARSSRGVGTRMGRAALVVSIGILLSRVLGFLRDVVLSAVLGGTGEGDVYDAAFVLPDFLFYLMAGGYLAITFIPILSRYVADDDEEGGWRAFVAIFRPVTIVVASLTVLAMIFTGPLVRFVYVRFPDAVGGLFGTVGEGLSQSQLDDVVMLTRIVLPAQVFFVMGALLSGVQYTHQRFLIPTLAPLVYNAAIMTGGLIGAGSTVPAAGFAWGALAGAATGSFALQLWGARRVGLRWMPGVALGHPALREYLVMALPLMIGQSLVVLDEQLVRIFGQFGDDGGIFALGRARRVNMVPVGMIAQAAGVAAYPFLARLAAEGRIDALASTLTRAMRYVVFVSVPAGAAVMALSEPAIRVALQRGNFDVADTTLTAAALVLYALSIPVWGAQQIYARGFYARRQMWTPVLVGTAGTVLAIPLFVWLSGPLGIPGLAGASTIALSSYTVVLAAIWYRRTGPREVWPVLYTLARSLVAGSVAGVAGWYVADLVAGPVSTMSFLDGFAGLLAGGLVVAAIYLAISTAIGSTEMRDLLRRRSASTGQPEPSSGSS